MEVRGVSRSGQAFVAATEGSQFTMYAVMKTLGLPLTEEQAKFQSYLERRYPPVADGQVREINEDDPREDR